MVEAVNRKTGDAAAKSRRARTQATSPLRERIPSLLPAQAETLRYFFAAPERWVLRDGGVLRFAPGRADAAGDLIELEADGARLSLRLESGARDARDTSDALRW